MAACASVPSAPKAIPDSFDEKTWEQQNTLLPPYPKPENLAGIYVSPNTSFRFFVDVASISVTPDGAVRYILMALSSGGATNVSYEAIRCKTYEHRTYAFGRSDGTWSQSRNPLWTPISGAQANRQHAVLAEEFFCPGGVPPRMLQRCLIGAGFPHDNPDFISPPIPRTAIGRAGLPDPL